MVGVGVCLLAEAGTAVGPKQRQENRQKDEAVNGAEEDDQEDHLEEGEVEIAGGEGEPDNPQDRAHGALDDG